MTKAPGSTRRGPSPRSGGHSARRAFAIRVSSPKEPVPATTVVAGTAPFAELTKFVAALKLQ